MSQQELPSNINDIDIVVHTEEHFQELSDEVIPADTGWFSLDTRKLRVGDGLTKFSDIIPFCYNEDVSIDVSGSVDPGSEDTVPTTKVINELIEQIESKIEELKKTVENNETDIESKVSNIESSYLKLSGGTLTGPLTLSGDPTKDNEAANKKYVDTGVSSAKSKAEEAKKTADTKAPIKHDSPKTTYGVGNSSNYGHLKLADSPNNSLGPDSGTAATPKSVYTVQEAAKAAQSTADQALTNTNAKSGVTAGSYGQASNATLTFSGTFNVPYVTVDDRGRTTKAQTVTLTMPKTPGHCTYCTYCTYCHCQCNCNCTCNCG